MLPKRREKIRSVSSSRLKDIIVVLEDIHDPHNAAAILRTCDALGIQDVWFVFGKETPYDPKKVGKASSSSANKWLTMRTFMSSQESISEMKREGYRIVVTALSDTSVSLAEYRVGTARVAIVLGNEHSGVSEAMLDSADTVIRIPMTGFVQSLNVSVSAGIVLWEIASQRVRSGNWMRTKKEQDLLYEEFIRRGTDPRIIGANPGGTRSSSRGHFSPSTRPTPPASTHRP